MITKTITVEIPAGHPLEYECFQNSFWLLVLPSNITDLRFALLLLHKLHDTFFVPLSLPQSRKCG